MPGDRKPNVLARGFVWAASSLTGLVGVASFFVSSYWPYAIPLVLISIGIGFLPWAGNKVAALKGAPTSYTTTYGGKLEPSPASSSSSGTLVLGNNRILSADLSSVVIEAYDKPLIKMGVDAQGVWIDTTVTDANGNYIGIVHGREFKASEERAFNPIQVDPQSIMIRDLSGTPVLDLHYDSSQQLTLKGYFHYGSGKNAGVIAMNDDGLRMGGVLLSGNTFNLGPGGKAISIGPSGIGIGVSGRAP